MKQVSTGFHLSCKEVEEANVKQNVRRFSLSSELIRGLYVDHRHGRNRQQVLEHTFGVLPTFTLGGSVG